MYVENTGDDPMPVELVSLHLPVDPVPTLPCLMFYLPVPTLCGATLLLLPWLPMLLVSSSSPIGILAEGTKGCWRGGEGGGDSRRGFS